MVNKLADEQQTYLFKLVVFNLRNDILVTI